MGTMKTTAHSSRQNKSAILWKRVLLAGFLSDLSVMVVLSAVFMTHMMIVSGQTQAQHQEFGELAGYYLAAPVAAIATFLFAFWAIRKLESHTVLNGTLVGVTATLLSAGFILGARPEHRLMYMVSFAARILAGYCSGLVSRTSKEGRRYDHAREVR
jgi:hypothetical protein